MDFRIYISLRESVSLKTNEDNFGGQGCSNIHMDYTNSRINYLY